VDEGETLSYEMTTRATSLALLITAPSPLLAGDAVTVSVSSKYPLRRHQSAPLGQKSNGRFRLDHGASDARHVPAADCGSEVDLYLRAKLGFCKLRDGVSDDASSTASATSRLLQRHVSTA